MKKVVYTCIFGDYDQLKEPLKHDPSFEHICFTDSPEKIKSAHWKVIPVYPNKEGLDNTRCSRKRKILFQEYFPDYDIVIWIDASIQIRCHLTSFAMSRLNNVDMAIMTHPGRDCLYEEGQLCAEIGKDNAAIISKQMHYYKSQNFPTNAGLVATGVIIRRNKENVRNLMAKWWEQIDKFSKRDQLSFNYVLWKFNYNVSINYMPFSILGGGYFKIFHHRHKLEERKKKRKAYIRRYLKRKGKI